MAKAIVNSTSSSITLREQILYVNFILKAKLTKTELQATETSRVPGLRELSMVNDVVCYHTTGHLENTGSPSSGWSMADKNIGICMGIPTKGLRM